MHDIAIVLVHILKATMDYHSLAMPQDAVSLVRRFRLDAFDWEGDGTAQGFADFIFFSGGVADLSRLGDLRYDYQIRCIEEGTEAVDSYFARERAEVEKCLSRVNGTWRALSAYVRKVKFSEMGFVWRHVARLATVHGAGRSGHLADLDAPTLSEISSVLEGFEQVFGAMHHTRHHDYFPGICAFEDHCVHSAILELDLHLENVPPWDGQEEPAVPVECDAVADLAGDQEFRAILLAAKAVAWAQFHARAQVAQEGGHVD